MAKAASSLSLCNKNWEYVRWTNTPACTKLAVAWWKLETGRSRKGQLSFTTFHFIKLLYYKRETWDTVVIVQEQEWVSDQFLSELLQQFPLPLTCLSFSHYKTGIKTITSTKCFKPLRWKELTVFYYVVCWKLLKHKAASKLHVIQIAKWTQTTYPLPPSMPSQSWLLETCTKLPTTSQPSCSKLCLSKLLFGARILLALLSYTLPALKTIKPHLFSACNN